MGVTIPLTGKQKHIKKNTAYGSNNTINGKTKTNPYKGYFVCVNYCIPILYVYCTPIN